MIKIIFLGTNGWYDTQTGNTVSILIRHPKYDIILDAGNGFAKIDKYLSFKKPVYLFLSHYHLDHIIGLHTLNKFNFKKGLHIIGPKGLKKMLNTIVQKPYTFPFSKLPYPTKVYELPQNPNLLNTSLSSCHSCESRNSAETALANPDHIHFPRPSLSFEYATLTHPVLTYGYRFQLDGKIITYCSDTGYCANAVSLARNADLLIAECAFKRGQELPQWPHLNPDTAARLAREANAKKLILTHFDASLYKTLKEREKAEKQARETFTNVASASDNVTIKL